MFGIGAGKIQIQVPKTSFREGEMIEGTLFLSVNTPIKARGLYITLYAEQKWREYTNTGTKRQLTDVTRDIYKYSLQLDGEKEYPQTCEPAAYPFTLTVPPSSPFSNFKGDPLHGMQIQIGPLDLGAGAGPLGPAQWFLKGYLDLALAFDIKSTIQLQI